MPLNKKSKINIRQIVNYWLKSADRKWETVLALKKARKYADCLFFCHLVLEYLLKALVNIETRKQAPYTHDLIRLAKLANTALTQGQKRLLGEINSFNFRARYADVKYDFYKKTTPSYAQKYFNQSNKIRLWLLKELREKMPKNSP